MVHRRDILCKISLDQMIELENSGFVLDKYFDAETINMGKDVAIYKIVPVEVV